MAVIADSLLVAIVTYSFLRSIFERSFRARYTLKAVLPRLLLVILMVNFGLALMQGAIEVARARGADHMDLGTSEDDVAARSLYESLGFINREGGRDGPVTYFYERDL